MAFETSHTAVEARMLERALVPGARVLEAGCGRRTRLEDWHGRIAELVGVDLDATAGRENATLDRFVAADLCAGLPFDTSSFDLVYANFVVEHLERPEAAFGEWRRVLRPSGRLVLLTANQANPLVALARAAPARLRTQVKRAGAGVAARDVIPVRYRANTPRRLQRLLREAGFEPIEIAYVATLHRYAERLPVVAAALRGLERALPPPLRSTIVACFRPLV